ncbi:MAG: hypothetical protein M0Z67_08795 [Nitrospiraceae bacterium]|nr:hypothetical protein [Nitrospiraceae bacterium]
MFKGILFVLAVIIIFTSSAFASSGWLVYHDGAFKGKVIDAETKEPIEGAVVVAIYHIREYGIAESGSSVADVKEVLTDKSGAFYIPAHTFLHLYPFANGEITTFLIFKPGYASIDDLDLTGILSWYGKEGVELPWIYNQKLKFVFAQGLIGLPKVKTREDRLKATPGHISEARRNTPMLNRLIDEEDRSLGLK